jgi:hypothetical protein
MLRARHQPEFQPDLTEERESPMTPSDVKATLSFSDGSPSMDLPIYKGTIGPT